MFKRLLALCFFIISFAVLANSAPTINLGADQFVLAGGNISLNASVNDPDGDELSVLWKVVFSPSGSKKELSQYTGVTTDLTLDRVGTFIIEATVSDGVTEVSDSVVILSSQTVGDLVFGPTNFFANPKCLGSSSRKDCIDSTDNFNISFPGNNYTLIARNNGYVSVSLGLNSNPITSFYDFSGGEEIFSKNVSLLSSNVLLSKIGGNPSASIEIEIRENVLPPDNNSKPILTVGNIEYFGNSGGEVSYSISDTDINDSHEIKILRQPNNGTIDVDGNVLNFIPRVNNQGDASALVALIDNGSPAKVDLKEITISFNSGNRPPEVNGNLPLSEGEVVSFTPEIIDNIGDSHQIAIKNQPVGGFASINGKAITFTPDGVYEGPINFEITVTDSGTPALSTDYIVTGQVNNNLPPLITGISSYSIPQTNSLNGSVSGSDPSINQVTNFYIANDPTNGELTLNSNGNFQYRPDFDFSGTDSFIIGISDNAVNPLNNQIEIQVNVEENFIPFSPSSPINVNINSGQSLSQNIVFIDENSLQNHTLEIVKEPIGGSVSLSGPLLTYNSDLSFSGEDEVVVGITDNGVPSKTGLVVLKFNVTGNNAPVPTVRWGLGSNQLASGITSNFTIIPNDPDSGQSHVYQITRNPLGGVIIPGGFWGNRFSYVPNEGFSGPDSFEVTVIDSGTPSLQTIIEVPLNVTLNSPPNPTDYSLEVLAGLNTGVTINANDIDRGQMHVLEILSQPVQSQATVVGNSIRIDAESTATGTETIQIRVTDNGTPAQSNDFNLTITYKTNAQPIFNNDELSYSGVELNSIFVSANYVDPDEIQGQAMNYEILNQPTNGSVDRFSIGRGRLSFRYMPNSGFVGNDSLVIRIFDNGSPSLSDLITVNFSVIQNSPPQPFASSQDILQGYSSAQITVFDGDPDENQRHEFGIFAQPAGGTTFIDERFGRLTYTPQSEFFGTDQIGVIVTERVNGIPALSGTTVVSIFVEENLPPTLSIDGIQSTFQSTPLSGNVELNDPNQRPTDSRFNGLYNWEILNNPTNGSVTIGQSGFYTYTPSLGFSGSDSFQVRVTETPSNSVPQVLSDTITVNIEVLPNTLPTLSYAPIQVISGEAVSGEIDIVDPDLNQIIGYELITSPSFGDLNLTYFNKKLIYSYTSTSFGGNDSFEIKVFDNALPNGESFVVIPISVEENLPPVVTGGTIDVFQGTAGQFTVTFTDPNIGQTHSYSISTNSQFGVSEISQSGVLTYTPNVGSTLDDSVVVRVTDSANPALFGEATVNINIIENTIPILSANPSNITTFQSTQGSTQVTFTDPDPNQVHTYSISTQPLNGSALINQSGLLTYTPNVGFSGSDLIEVAVSDDSTPSGVGTLAVNVTVQANSLPVVTSSPTNLNTFQGNPISGVLSFTDADNGQTHTYQVQTQGAKGVTVINGSTGVYTYTPNIGEFGSDQIIFAVEDSANPAGVGTLIVDVEIQANTPPVISGNFNFQTFQSTEVEETFNISDIDQGQIISLNLDNDDLPQNGVVNLELVSGTSDQYLISYTPNVGFSGTDSFTVIASDDANPNGISQQLVNISIQANSLPEVDNKDLSFVQSDNSKSVQVTFNDSDIGQTHSYQIVNQGAKGTATIDQNGLLTYVPSFSASGADSVTFSVIDNAIPGGVGEGVLTINIDPNAAPELLGPSEVTILTSRSFDYQFSATDINPNQELIFSISQFPSEVNAFIDQTSGLLTISAGEFFVGLDSVEVTVFDNGNPQLNDVINLTINVDKGNTRPNPTANDIDVLAGTSGTTQIFPNDPDLNNLHNYLILQQPTNGIASVDSTGLVTYTPNIGFTGNETINVSVTDNGEPNLGAIVSISVSVQSNSAPDPIGTSIEILAGRNESFLLDPNDPDPNQSWTYSVDVVPTDGAVSVDQSGNVDFSTDNLESGSGTFEIKVTDDGNPNLSGNAIFNYTIIENGEPIVGSDSIFVNKNTPFNGQLSWSDINQAIQTFSFSITSNPSNGSVSIDQSGNFAYTPNAEYLGADQFSIRVTDDTGLFGEGTISVTVSEGNLNPVINGVTFDVLDTSGPFKTRFTLDVDDPDGDVVSGVIDFGDGRPSQVLDTSIVPEEFLNPIYHQYDSSGSYTVSLTITDNSGGTASLTAPIDVNLNSPPVANISANTFSGVAPLIVNFDASSSSDDTGINEYVWTVLETDEEYFGVSPSITFSNSGLYNVELKLKDVDSAVTVAKVQISVDQGGINQLPEFNFLSSNFQSSTFPFLVTTSISGEVDFDGTVTEIVQYSGDPLGPDMAFGNSGSFNYFKPGTYFQKAVVRDDFDEARLKERAVYVGPEEAPLIGVFPIQTGPFEVKMDSLIKGRYDKNSLIWDFGDGQFSNEIAPTHTYSASGTYLVKVYYFDVYGNYTSADREIYIDGNNYDPVIVSDFPFYQEISPGTSISFDISGSNDPGGNPLDGSVVDFKTGNLAIDTTTGSETFNDVGFYDVTVYVVNDKGMTTKESVYVNVISGDGPQPVGSVDISSGSAPLTFTLDATGSFHNSGTITESLWKSNSLPNEFGLPIGTPNQIETLTLESPGVYDFELWVRDNLGNTRQQTISVEVTN